LSFAEKSNFSLRSAQFLPQLEQSCVQFSSDMIQSSPMSAYCTILEREVGFDAAEVQAFEWQGKKCRGFVKAGKIGACPQGVARGGSRLLWRIAGLRHGKVAQEKVSLG
jgi:hypothetical protein